MQGYIIINNDGKVSILPLERHLMPSHPAQNASLLLLFSSERMIVIDAKLHFVRVTYCYKHSPLEYLSLVIHSC